MDSSSDSGGWDPSGVVSNFTNSPKASESSTKKAGFDDINDFWQKNSPKQAPIFSWEQPAEIPKRTVGEKVNKPKTSLSDSKIKNNITESPELKKTTSNTQNKPISAQAVPYQTITISSTSKFESDDEITGFGPSSSDVEEPVLLPHHNETVIENEKQKIPEKPKITKPKEPPKPKEPKISGDSTKKRTKKSKEQNPEDNTKTSKSTTKKTKGKKEEAAETTENPTKPKKPKNSNKIKKERSPSSLEKQKSEVKPKKVKEETSESQKPAKTKKSQIPKYDFSVISSDDDIQIIIPEIDDSKQENEDLPMALRRSKRIRVKPLRHWMGEHVKYGVGEGNLRYVAGIQNYSTMASRVTTPMRSQEKKTVNHDEDVKTKKAKVDIVSGPYKEEEITIPADDSMDFTPETFGRHVVHLDGSGVMNLNGRQYRLEEHSDFYIPPNQECHIESRLSSPLTLLVINYK
ncbi:hypothetical protein TVAG_018410 [Trichomonas vaginalis G3]|uniref:Mif2/CENP-C cupin domain-containing protein n=1 Tax=Trichomonas vaginalis (strain ATCC PRA-98 / G3) TaxID=412133 RepID=A2F9X7_TRIV3|nr:hypothetical protein TVAGG3_0506450 [Trichomonas vaginalis G3]EAX98305.1 hypothetical protein TVAG_018410 [Trichomonas vaginalis G3]KAI5517459.1 hypothetical protein TVAGG3_0506450 [Trichomonas vaginalis G3]|eukprot:XP_001311235.1 hypothetical protein [Trichomonas vaginalis G3]